MRLLIATRNAHKLREIREIFCAPGLELLGADEAGSLPDVVEDRDTFEANAVKKAAVLAGASGMFTLADDSGLEVACLGGRPGVYSARYAGEPVDYAANNRKLLEEMQGAEDRSARFRCVVALAEPGGPAETVAGVCPGRICEALRGAEGFGYDPLFVPEGYDQTFAEMPASLKNRISHRAAALRAAAAKWDGRLAE